MPIIPNRSQISSILSYWEKERKLFLELMDGIAHGNSGENQKKFLEEIVNIEGVYIPSFYDITYHGDFTIKSISSKIQQLSEANYETNR